MKTHPIRFYHRGAIREVSGVPVTRTVLQHLRDDMRCTGTKEGCAEGDCGACTVVVGELDAGGELVLKAVNACIRFLPTLDGCALFTVEDLRAPDGTLHPVQQALVDCHGSQCGFCTPGFAMSMWALYENYPPRAGLPTRDEVATALSGNLCRCTGYRPIVDAAQHMLDTDRYARVALDRAPIVHALREMREARNETFSYASADLRGSAFGENRFWAPTSLDAFAQLRAEHPHALVLAGSTDVGLWATKQLRDFGDVLYVGRVTELATIERDAAVLAIGAAATLEDAYGALIVDYPELAELAKRFASLPVRNAGTLGGNIANGSPIGDSMPALIALDTQIVLRRGGDMRVMPLDAFYLGYQKTALEAGEFVVALRIPRPATTLRFRTYKVSKRYDQDISAVCAAFAIEVIDGTVANARIAFGGMAATPKRASLAEAALTGSAWNEQALERAIQALAGDYQPLTDLRASSRYRSTIARNLLRRFWLETRDEAPLTLAQVDVFAFDAAFAKEAP